MRPVETSEQDFRVGGSWHYSMIGPEGTESWGKAIYEDIDPLSKIIYKDYFSDKDGNIDITLPSSTVTVLLDGNDGTATLTSLAVYESAEVVRKLVEMGMVEGIKDTWRQLEELVRQFARGA